MYDSLREEGRAEKADLLAEIDADALGYASDDSVWANLIKGRDSLRALPGVESPPPGRSTWQFDDS
jgi:hypothetical protein